MVYKFTKNILGALFLICCSVYSLLAIEYQVLFPPDGYYTKNDHVVIKAQSSGAKEAVINGQKIAVKRGKIYHKVSLIDGENKIKIDFFNGTEKSSAKLVVNKGDAPLKATVVPKIQESLSYSIKFPPKKIYKTVNDQILIKAIGIKGVDSVLINGKKFLVKSGRIFYKFPLDSVENTFNIVFKNEKISKQETYKVIKTINYDILYPPTGYKTDKELVLVKIRTKGAKEAFINGEAVKIKSGRIFHKVKLSEFRENVINVMLKNKKVSSSFSINVLRKDQPSLTSVKESTDTLISDDILIEDKKVKETQIKEPQVKEVVDVPEQKVVVDPSLSEANLKKEIMTTVKQEMVTSRKELLNDVQDIIKKADQIKKESDKESKSDSYKSEVSSMFEKMHVKMSLIFKRLKDIEETKTESPQDSFSRASSGKTITIKLRDANIKDVVEILAKKANINIVADQTLKGKVTVDLKDVDLNTALNLVLKSHGYTYAMIENTLVVGEADKINTTTTLQSQVFRLSQAKVKNVLEAIKPFIEPPEKVAMAEEENSLIVYAAPSTLSKIKKTISDLDRRNTKQVFIEAKIIEVGTNVLDKIGVNWNGQTKVSWVDSDSSDGSSGDDSSSDDSTASSGSSSSGINKEINVSDAEVIINYIKSTGESKILATPKMSAVNGKEAQIHVGDRYPYVISEIDSKTGELETTVKFIDTGTKLSITPYINNAADTIKLKIKIEVSFIFGFAGSNNEIPWVRTREAESTIIVQNGKSAVIGGLINNENKISESAVPILSDLPILGNLFKGQTTEQTETELIIAITPTILNDEF